MKSQATSTAAPATPLAVLKLKGIEIGMGLFMSWSKLHYRLRRPWGGKLGFIDHITIPCRDLRVAEEFYVGLLAARVMLRIDEPMLRRMGRPAEEIAESVHLSLAFGSGARLDLFQAPDGQPPYRSPHPHIALRVSAGEMLRWKARLNARGVPTFGPTRLGPPGQASLYFNDPSGNHLEIVTLGFTGETLVGAPDMDVLPYEWKPS